MSVVLDLAAALFSSETAGVFCELEIFTHPHIGTGVSRYWVNFHFRVNYCCKRELRIEPLLYIERSQLRWFMHLIRMPPASSNFWFFYYFNHQVLFAENNVQHFSIVVSIILQWKGKCDRVKQPSKQHLWVQASRVWWRSDETSTW